MSILGGLYWTTNKYNSLTPQKEQLRCRRNETCNAIDTGQMCFIRVINVVHLEQKIKVHYTYHSGDRGEIDWTWSCLTINLCALNNAAGLVHCCSTPAEVQAIKRSLTTQARWIDPFANKIYVSFAVKKSCPIKFNCDCPREQVDRTNKQTCLGTYLHSILARYKWWYRGSSSSSTVAR